MIENLTINFEYEGLQYSIAVPSDYNNLPYNLAAAFREIIEKSDANSDIVIKQLIEDTGYQSKDTE